MMTSFYYKKGADLESDLSRARLLSVLGEKNGILWVDLENPTEFESDALVEIFNFHPLAVEDCINDQSQPKVDDYGEYLFIVVHALVMRQQGKHKELGTLEMDLFLGQNYVVTFHNAPIGSITQAREQTRRKTEIFFGSGSDILAHMLLDHLVDSYLPVIHEYDERIDQLEKHMFRNNASNYLQSLLQIKQDIFTLRRIIAPQRDTLYTLTRNPTPFIKMKNLMYFRDIYDHLFRIHTMAESYHDTLNSILQVYFSYASTKLNEVMKRLTVLATIAMPAMIIASLYGMNFKNIPELHWQHGYLFSIGLMFFTTVALLVWMKIKKWI